MIRSKSLKFKLVLSYLLVIFISFGFIAFYLDRNLEENALQDIKKSLLNQGYLIESQLISQNAKKQDPARLEALVQEIAPKIGCRISIIDDQGRVLADSERTPEEVLLMDNHARRPEIRAALGGKMGESTRYSSTLKIDMLYLAIPLRQKDSLTTGALRLALPLESVRRMLLVIRKSIILSVSFALGLAFVLGSLLAAGIVKPLRKIINVSRRFSAGDFAHKIFYESDDEIGELAATLNKMAQEIEDKVRQTSIQNQHLKAILYSMIEGIVVVDKDARIVSLNPPAETIFNIDSQGADRRLLIEAIPNNEISGIISDVLKGGVSASKEITLVWPLQRVFQLNASPIFVNNSVAGAVAVIHDITEIRRLEVMRRDFVANVSHELKTPLTSIKGFVETLLEGALEDKKNKRHFLEIIREHVDRLDNLVNDLLSLSYLESREIRLDKKEFDLRGLADESLAGFKSQIKKKALEVANDLPSGLSVKADRDRIEQVLINLIDNAVKFNNNNGSINVYCEESPGQLKVFVEDTGAGIPAKDIPRIFERFYRVDKARSRELAGTGLGLSIVKHIVELHGGSAGVESTEGLGSRFWFTLPL